MFNGTSTGTGTWGAFNFQVHQRHVPTGNVEVQLYPPVRPGELLHIAQQAAVSLWPDRKEQGIRAVVPLIASVAREANNRQKPVKFRIVRHGDRQHLEPVLPPPPADGEWPADAEIVATERNRIIDA